MSAPAANPPAANPPGANQPAGITDAEITAAILRLLEACGPAKSISPNDVACALDPVWHPLLGRVRRAAVGLALAGRIHILRKGQPVDPAAARGVVRLRLRPPEDAP